MKQEFFFCGIQALFREEQHYRKSALLVCHASRISAPTASNITKHVRISEGGKILAVLEASS